MLIGFIDFTGIGYCYMKTNKADGEITTRNDRPGAAMKEEEAQLLRAQWTDEDDELLEELKQAILDNPVLKRPVRQTEDFISRRIELQRTRAVLCQAGCLEEEAVEERTEGEETANSKRQWED
jgi:hypothetical protein